MKPIVYILIPCCLVFHIIVTGQNDSIYPIDSRQDVDKLLLQVEYLKHQDPHQAMAIAKACNDWCNVNRYPLGQGKSMFWSAWLGIKMQKQQESSVLTLTQAQIGKRIFQKIKDYFWLARSQELLASIYYYQGKVDVARQFLDHAQTTNILISNKVDSIDIAAEILNNKGTLALQKKSTKEAISYFQQSIELFAKAGKKEELARGFNNLSLLYNNDNEYIAAKRTAQKALHYTTNSHDKSRSLLRLGQAYLLEYDSTKISTKWDSTIYYLNQSLNHNHNNKSEIYNFLVYAHLLRAEQDSIALIGPTKKLIDQAIEVATVENNLNSLYELMPFAQLVCRYLEDCHILLLKLEAAFQQIKDFSIQATNNASTQLAQYDLAETEYQAKREQQFIIGVAIIILMLLSLVGLAFFQRYKTKVRNQELEAELEAKDAIARAQLHPHFISNTLNAIDLLIDSGETETASKYIIKLDRLCRSVLESSKNPQISLQEEMDLLNNYLALQQLRFEEQLKFDIKLVNEKVDPETVSLPPMFLQPIVENAIKHGIKNKSTSGHIKVLFDRFTDKYIHCVVEDDGVGREKAKELQSKQVFYKEGSGEEILNERIKVFQKKGQTATNMETIDLYDEKSNPKGTRVELTLPILPDSRY